MRSAGSFSPGIVAGVALATIAQSMDGRMMTGLLPSIQGALAFTPDEGSWLIVTYLCANIIVLALSPWLAFRFGRRRYFLVSTLGFGVCALLCAASTSLSVLLILRFIQGAFGGGLISTSHAIFRETFPDSRLGISQVAFVGSFVGAPLTFGPLIAGYLSDGNYYWQWMFSVDAALAAAAFVLCRRFLPDDRPALQLRFDLIGTLLFAGFAVPAQYVLTLGERYDWFNDPHITELSFLAVACLGGLSLWHAYNRRAIFSAALESGRNAAVVAAMIFPIGLVLAGCVAVAVAFTERLLDFTATMAGEMLVLRALVFLPLTVVAGALMDKRSPRAHLPVVVGLLLLAGGFILQWQWATTDTGFSLVVIALAVSGLGIGPAFIPLLWWLFRKLPAPETLGVTTLVDTALAFGTTAASALIPTVIDRSFQLHYSALRARITFEHLFAAHVSPTLKAIRQLTFLVTQQSYALAFADVAFVLTAIALLSIPLVLLVEHEEAQSTT
jgi:DHA2 family multidrug resistance protein